MRYTIWGVTLHLWVRSKAAQTHMKWPNGFWKGTTACGFGLYRYNAMISWRKK